MQSGRGYCSERFLDHQPVLRESQALHKRTAQRASGDEHHVRSFPYTPSEASCEQSSSLFCTPLIINAVEVWPDFHASQG